MGGFRVFISEFWCFAFNFVWAKSELDGGSFVCLLDCMGSDFGMFDSVPLYRWTSRGCVLI